MSWVSKTFFRKAQSLLGLRCAQAHPAYIELKAQDGDRIVFKILQAKQVGDTIVMELEQVKEHPMVAVEV